MSMMKLLKMRTRKMRERPWVGGVGTGEPVCFQRSKPVDDGTRGGNGNVARGLHAREEHAVQLGPMLLREPFAKAFICQYRRGFADGNELSKHKLGLDTRADVTCTR
jgi:hypothetical protein